MDIMEPGYKMLGSTGTQYLNPDYVQPLATTLDSKNSPLALLAQTCSSIGKDSGSSSSSSSSSSTSKLSLPSLSDKKDQREVNGGGALLKDTAYKQRPSESPIGGGGCPAGSNRSGDPVRGANKTTEKPSKDCASRSSSSGAGGGDGSPKARVHSSRPLSSLVSLSNGSGKCTPSSSSSSSSAAAFSATGGGSHHRDYGGLRGSSTSAATSATSGISVPLSASIGSNSKAMDGSSSSLLFDGYPDDILKSTGLSSSLLQQQQQNLQEVIRLQHEGLQSLQAAGLPPLPSSYHPLLFGNPLAAAAAAAAALDPLMYSYSASLAAVHGLAMSSHKLPPTLSPYMGYARVGTGSGGSTLVPVCKDPYCTTGSMPLSLHSAHGLPPPPSGTGSAAPPCGSGCTQCGSSVGQDKSHQCTGQSAAAAAATSLSSGGVGGLGAVGQFPSSLYPLSLPPPGAGGLTNPLLGMAAAQLGVGLTPYACSWLSGGEFCGKRFSKADDLLQHLRSHASSGDPALPAFPLPGVAMPTPGFVGAGSTGHPFSIPGSLSPSSLLAQPPQPGQAYSRSLSPNSLLTASRYHPYKSPFAAVLPTSTGTAAAGSNLPGAASALDAYYSSPYALFGHRGIGAAAVGP